MKRFFIRIVLLVMGIAISGSMVGCNRKETEIDAQFMLESLLTEVTYETELEQVGSNADMYFWICLRTPRFSYTPVAGTLPMKLHY